jgi:hypothetical protein
MSQDNTGEKKNLPGVPATWHDRPAWQFLALVRIELAHVDPDQVIGVASQPREEASASCIVIVTSS